MEERKGKKFFVYIGQRFCLKICSVYEGVRDVNNNL